MITDTLLTEMSFARTDKSILGHWWWTVDRWLLGFIGILIAIGIFLTFAASPAVAERIGADTYHFVKRQLVFLPVGIGMIFALSLQSPRMIRRLALLGFIGTIGLMAATLLIGTEIKGASRWISLGGFSLQPSEFIKPTFAVVAAWMFSQGRLQKDVPGIAISCSLYALVVALLLMQPDLGMTIVVTCVWCTQFFLAGLPVSLVILLMATGVFGLIGAYAFFPHVQSRVDRFLDPASGDTYQVQKSLEAFENGGFFGRGPGEGRVKEVLPDAHTDFILAVAGEEFGALLCLVLVALFIVILWRGMILLLKEENYFIFLATAGILIQFSLQAFINMASTLHLGPTKGMTLPFISYGGSSFLSLSLAMGMVLALTRKRTGSDGV